jgi:hypothetical protein
MRPVIGITSYAQDARWGVWHLPAALVPLAYVDAVERAGGRAIGERARQVPRLDANAVRIPGAARRRERSRRPGLLGRATDGADEHAVRHVLVEDDLVDTG